MHGMACSTHVADSAAPQFRQLGSSVPNPASALNVSSSLGLRSLMLAVQEQLEEMLFPDSDALLADLSKSTGPRFRALNRAVAKLVDGFGMVGFTPLDVSDEDRCDFLSLIHVM